MTWTTLTKSWHDTSVDYCDVCGNLLINRYWSFVGPVGTTLRVCREDDEELAAWLHQQRAAHQPPWEAATDG